jgi:hypothetical protein
MSILMVTMLYGEFLLKMGCKFIFPIFMRSSYMHPCGLIAQGLKGRVLKKKFVLSIEFWVFIFFHFFSFAHGSI